MDIIDRIQEIINHENLNVASFAKKIGAGDQTVRGIVVQRRNKPGFDILLKTIQTFPWLNVEWLLTGEGEMIKVEYRKNTSATPTLKELIKYLREKELKIQQLIEEKTEWRVRYEITQKELQNIKGEKQ